MSHELRNGDVHVWHIELDAADWRNVPSVLRADEREKMGRFRTARLQSDYQRCRNALRVILGRYLQCAPGAILFDYGGFGKPAIVGAPVCFNVSHSAGHALIALSRHPLGIDIECTRPSRIDIAALLPYVCHASELAELKALHDNAQAQAFYRLWTRKEAYCKAIGIGLHQSLPALRFNLYRGATAVVDENREGAGPFFVHDVNVAPQFSASTCLTLESVQIRHFAYSQGVTAGC